MFSFLLTSENEPVSDSVLYSARVAPRNIFQLVLIFLRGHRQRVYLSEDYMAILYMRNY